MLKTIVPFNPQLAIVLGSGLSGALNKIENSVVIPYSDLPGFPLPTIQGHEGRLIVGLIGCCPVAVLAGRSHYYEGLDMETVTFPIRVLAEWGVGSLLLTNAAGGINPNLRPGDLMVVTDHINFMGENPLRKSHGKMGLGFVDLSEVYDPQFRRLLGAAARKCGLKLRFGVYLAVSGPTFETPAEIRAFAKLGADAIGMSTVPEAIVARHCNMRVAAVSLITNRAAGMGCKTISHEEVDQVAQKSQARLRKLIVTFLQEASIRSVFAARHQSR